MFYQLPLQSAGEFPPPSSSGEGGRRASELLRVPFPQLLPERPLPAPISPDLCLVDAGWLLVA